MVDIVFKSWFYHHMLLLMANGADRKAIEGSMLAGVRVPYRFVHCEQVFLSVLPTNVKKDYLLAITCSHWLENNANFSVSHEQRVCPCCGLNVEDLYHLVFDCAALSQARGRSRFYIESCKWSPNKMNRLWESLPYYCEQAAIIITSFHDERSVNQSNVETNSGCSSLVEVSCRRRNNLVMGAVCCGDLPGIQSGLGDGIRPLVMLSVIVMCVYAREGVSYILGSVAPPAYSLFFLGILLFFPFLYRLFLLSLFFSSTSLSFQRFPSVSRIFFLAGIVFYCCFFTFLPPSLRFVSCVAAVFAAVSAFARLLSCCRFMYQFFFGNMLPRFFVFDICFWQFFGLVGSGRIRPLRPDSRSPRLPGRRIDYPGARSDYYQ